MPKYIVTAYETIVQRVNYIVRADTVDAALMQAAIGETLDEHDRTMGEVTNRNVDANQVIQMPNKYIVSIEITVEADNNHDAHGLGENAFAHLRETFNDDLTIEPEASISVREA